MRSSSLLPTGTVWRVAPMRGLWRKRARCRRDSASAAPQTALLMFVKGLVLGTHGRRGARRMLLGSDAEQVLRTATVPVLLVRSAETAPALSRPRRTRRPGSAIQSSALSRYSGTPRGGGCCRPVDLSVQRDISTGTVIDASSPLVAPPSIRWIQRT